MAPSKPIISRNWTAIALLLIAAAIISLMIFSKKSSSVRDVVETPGPGNITAHNGGNTSAPKKTEATTDHLASVAVIVLNNGKEFPLGIKVGEKYINIPGPSSWSKNGDKGSDGAETGRFLAGIVDTADVLKANGFKPNDTFSLVVGGTALNASNTFRVAGNHQPDPALSDSNGYTEEYHTLPDEEGIWRSLKFKNVVLSYGEVPTLADFLVAPPTRSPMPPMLDQPNANGTSSTLNYPNPAAMARDKIQAEKETQKFRDAMNSSNPAIRAEGIQNIVLYGDDMAADSTHPGVAKYLEKALEDQDHTVRKAALDSLDLWDGDIPMQSLSRIVLNDQDPELRKHALSILADRFNEQAVPTLQQASHDPDTEVAQKASQLLGTLTP